MPDKLNAQLYLCFKYIKINCDTNNKHFCTKNFIIKCINNYTRYLATNAVLQQHQKIISNNY